VMEMDIELGPGRHDPVTPRLLCRRASFVPKQFLIARRLLGISEGQ
jgi:hypothetical protein